AYEVAKMVIMGMKQLGLPIVSALRKDWHDFLPIAPDSWQRFTWYPTLVYDTMKPDGK
ncbi:MAG: rhamnogalacturonan acetylesterase, partial [Prevotella salivae]|nr:rhamnogalacturonan acetylesterase [Segatella salivae]